MSAGERAYRPIGDYALIGNAHTAALVSSDGAIDWLCWPRFDSPAVFCRLLDADRGGYFRVGPAGGAAITRSYAGDTNVLVTSYTTGTGRVQLTDFMPAPWREPATTGAEIAASHRILRLVEGLAGEMALDVSFRPTFDYARATTEVAPHALGAIARAGAEALLLRCPVPLSPDPAGGVRASLSVAAGERHWFVLTYAPNGQTAVRPDGADEDALLARTLAYWRAWSTAGTYTGPYRRLVQRSALVLKLLTFAPTGAVVAAPTTSLPEAIGGVRNWDYRYAWLRDSALLVYALMTTGYHDEARRFFDWIEGLGLERDGDLQILYRIDGGRETPEQTLDHLAGYRDSRPVRIGNGAAGQRQLDVYGAVLDAAYLCYTELPRPLDHAFWTVLRWLADQAAERWREPDRGIWEVRGGPRHFLYSKLLCWVALDRALRLAARMRLPGPLDHWRRTRSVIRQALLDEGYDRGLGAFTQAFGEPTLDASALAIPLVGFLPPTDPRVLSTVARIQERLTARDLVYRYLADDGLPGGEATFVLCSFWLVDTLALAGRVDEARTLFERVTGYANDLGLLAEEIDPASGELLGNYPQGFTHLALIRSAFTLAQAQEGDAHDQAQRPAAP